MDEPVPKRSVNDTLLHMELSVDSGVPVYGVLKKSVLIELNNFNIISGFVPDSMHSIDLGIAKQFIKYWVDSKNMPYCVHDFEVQSIDTIMKDIKVPCKLTRYSRSIRDRSCWKAREHENWVLYYSTIVLLQIPRLGNYVQHWSYLVKAYYILLLDNISFEQVCEADHLLQLFVALTQYYYSTSAMTFNVHQLLHLSQSVINWGPLWTHFGFGFENGNGKIVRQVKAAKGVVHQICRNIGMSRSELVLKKFLKETDPNSVILDYTEYLESKECWKTERTNMSRYFGKGKRPTVRWIRELNLSDSAFVYQKMIQNESLLDFIVLSSTELMILN
ncbi:hypothetical protein TKK_0017582 [Trichogramma kaykai]|uniref:Uncharacterized protein n=1 Tax=Trichogramma kaykai TaxID=54128 RepID=A0ABD2W2I8_9HYME